VVHENTLGGLDELLVTIVRAASRGIWMSDPAQVVARSGPRADAVKVVPYGAGAVADGTAPKSSTWTTRVTGPADQGVQLAHLDDLGRSVGAAGADSAGLGVSRRRLGRDGGAPVGALD
jgi:hypothetical protein